MRYSPSRCWAPAASSGLPTVFFTIGSAAAAVGVGRISQRLGRRAGLSAGYLTGALGSLGVVIAAGLGNVVLLFASMLVYGAGVVHQFAGAVRGSRSCRTISTRPGGQHRACRDCRRRDHRPQPGQRDRHSRQSRSAIPPLAGPFMLAGAAYASAGLVLWLLLRPDPLLLARSIAAAQSRGPRRSCAAIRTD